MSSYAEILLFFNAMYENKDDKTCQKANPICSYPHWIYKKRWEHLESLFLRFIIYAKQEKDKLSSNKKISRPPRKYITKVIYNY